MYHIILNIPSYSRENIGNLLSNRCTCEKCLLEELKMAHHLDSSKRNHLKELACGSLIFPLLGCKALLYQNNSKTNVKIQSSAPAQEVFCNEYSPWRGCSTASLQPISLKTPFYPNFQHVTAKSSTLPVDVLTKYNSNSHFSCHFN